MDELLSVATLIAAVGALAASLLNIWVTRMHARESEKMRLASALHEKRLEAYSEIAAKAHELYEAAMFLLIDSETDEEVSHDQVVAYWDKRNALEALAHRHVTIAGTSVMDSLTALINVSMLASTEGSKRAAGGSRITTDRLEELFGPLHDAEDALVAALRSDLKAEELTADFHRLLPASKAAREREKQKALPSTAKK